MPVTITNIYTATDGVDSAGLSYLRVPLGASDFSASGADLSYFAAVYRTHSCCPAYSYDDQSGDTSLSAFNINRAPSYVFSVINDIRAINPYLKVHVLPWSPVRIHMDLKCFYTHHDHARNSRDG